MLGAGLLVLGRSTRSTTCSILHEHERLQRVALGRPPRLLRAQRGGVHDAHHPSPGS